MPRKVTMIPQTINPQTRMMMDTKVKKKVAGYARVSTDFAEQLTSYEAQVAYYTSYIQGRNDWEFVGVYHAEVQAFLVKYFSNGAAKSVQEPLDTVTTKDRFALVTIHGEEYIITDIRMRMLQPRELFNAQGFPADYIIDHDSEGKPYSKTAQVARCGNAVTPPVPAALVKANLPEFCKEEQA